ncbi:hypothetical protein TYRP_018482 [Tyrophagus putrescentiae]|nr:hypothetical protein TYRP_018482 [Tyrophagus putrescentiae]
MRLTSPLPLLCFVVERATSPADHPITSAEMTRGRQLTVSIQEELLVTEPLGDDEVRRRSLECPNTVERFGAVCTGVLPLPPSSSARPCLPSFSKRLLCAI